MDKTISSLMAIIQNHEAMIISLIAKLTEKGVLTKEDNTNIMKEVWKDIQKDKIKGN